MGVAICVAVVRDFIVLCNSVSADRSEVAASRFLAATAACVILVCFAAESRKSYCNGRVKVANVATGVKVGEDDFSFKFRFF